MSGSQESLRSGLYARASEQRLHGDYYAYLEYFCRTIRPNTIRTEYNTNRIFGTAIVCTLVVKEQDNIQRLSSGCLCVSTVINLLKWLYCEYFLKSEKGHHK